jgi:hypothetical protein
MFSEIRRGNLAGGHVTTTSPMDPQDVRQVGTMTGADLTTPPTSRNATLGTAYTYAGLEYFRSFAFASFYTHTVPPNYTGGDCTDLNDVHLAAQLPLGRRERRAV